MADPRIDNTPDGPDVPVWNMGWEPSIEDTNDIRRAVDEAASYYDSLATDRVNAINRDLARAEILTGDVRSVPVSDVRAMLADARQMAADVTGNASGAVSDDVARIFAAAADIPGLDASPESVVAQAMGVPYVAPVGQGGPSATMGPGAIPSPFTGQPVVGTPVVPVVPPSPASPTAGGGTAGPVANPGPSATLPNAADYPVGSLLYNGTVYPPGTQINDVYVPGVNGWYVSFPAGSLYAGSPQHWRQFSGDFANPPTSPVSPSSPPPVVPPAPKDCIEICGMSELIEALKGKNDKDCEPTKYKLYCRKGEGLILAGVDADAPQGSELVASGVPQTSWFKLAQDCLDKDKDDKPEEDDEEDQDTKPQEQPPNGGVGGCEADISVPLVFGRPNAEGAISAITKELIGGDTDTVDTIAAGGIAGTYAIFKVLYSLPYTIAKAMARPYQAMLSARNCDSGPLVGLGIMSFFGGIAERYFAVYAPWFNVPIQQSTNYHCPVNVPGTADATSAYLGNTISEETLECWVRMSGDKYPQFRKVIESRQSRLSILEAINAVRRNKMTEQGFAEHCRRLGYLDTNIPDVLLSITTQIPVLSDILRFMVRDAGDDALAQKLGTDALFAQKYSGQLKSWADQQGIDQDYAKYAWRSHWSLPSPTQLYEMLHRLRFSDIPPDQQVTEKDIEDALIQDDKLPYWVPKFMAISYRVPGRIDIKRAYALGVIDEHQVMRAFQELGYNDANADIQTQSTKREVAKSRYNLPIIRQFVRGDISQKQLEDWLNKQNYDQTVFYDIVNYAAEARETARVVICLKSIRKGFLQGQYDDSELAVQLSYQNIATEHADELTRRWKCEKASRDRQATAAMLAGWYVDGSLDDTEYYTRLRNLGWNATDAARMVQSSRDKIKARTEKETKLRLRAEEMEREKTARQLEKTAKQAAANEAKRKREAQTAEAERAKFGVRILSAAEKFAAKTGEELHTERDWIHGQVYGRFPTSPLTPMEVVQAAQTVSELSGVIDRQTWLEAFLPLVS